MHYMDANKTHGEKAWRQLLKNAVNSIEQGREAAPNKAAAIRPPTTNPENYQSSTNQTCETAEEVRTNS